MKIYSIYRITNLVNDKKYIGYTSNKLGHRFYDHCSTKKPKYQERSIISIAIEKYGVDNFICDILYQSLDYEHCRKIESNFIEEYNTLTHTQGGHGYNVDAGGTGHKRSKETIEKHRAKIKGRPQSEEHKRNKGLAVKGEKNGMHGKTQDAHPRWGASHSEETKRKMSITQKKRLEMYGAHNKNIPLSEEHNRKLQEGRAKKPPKYKKAVIRTPIGQNVNLYGKEILDYCKLHKLNNFMPLLVKNPTRSIKGYSLIEYELT